MAEREETTTSIELAAEQCEIAGHTWVHAGGGLLECALCGAEQWGEEEATDAT